MKDYILGTPTMTENEEIYLMNYHQEYWINLVLAVAGGS